MNNVHCILFLIMMSNPHLIEKILLGFHDFNSSIVRVIQLCRLDCFGRPGRAFGNGWLFGLRLARESPSPRGGARTVNGSGVGALSRLVGVLAEEASLVAGREIFRGSTPTARQ